MEIVAVTAEFWRGRRVLITGITGFKGSWLALWLRELGATVVGYSLAPPTVPSLFEHARVLGSAEWVEGDVRDTARLRRAVIDAAPEIVFHLAAQPLVRVSYEMPVETFETNVLGTVNLLDSLRTARSVRAAVIVTTDKCYENREWFWPYRETDVLGGHDPYSSSKACAEVVTSAYYRSFFKARDVGVATARAGNVIGGGDWARDRLIPDSIAALEDGQSIFIRNPESMRPWQHVLDPLMGYLSLAERLISNSDDFSTSWNFGPGPEAVRPVAELAQTICSLWGDGARWHSADAAAPHEAGLLALDASKAYSRLGWRPRLSLRDTLAWTIAWHKALKEGEDMRVFTLHQIKTYEETQS